ncbi:MAG: helix-turn-helix domain-containing protein [Nocardioides sp.]|uniref:helix-turn-helix domain-containing protein n=1 Tax=Nocardioides sp. TaxID=35761 RepID=UPI0039E49571
MDASQVELLRTIDPVELGKRIGSARRAGGLTQGELAQGAVSVGYVSRIEAGQRRPTPAVLEALAAPLNVDPADLLLGVSAAEYDDVRLQLSYAELALESGEATEAATKAAEVVSRGSGPTFAPLHERARHVHAAALEALGLLDDAIIELEDLLDDLAPSRQRLKVAIDLSRCYRESGDLNRAIDVGGQVLRGLAGTSLEGVDEAVRLTVTVAAAYFERGDTAHAVRLCQRAARTAERLDSQDARAAAYWNMSMMEAQRGAVRSAVDLAERAIELLREGQSDRDLARLQAQLGMMQLELDPPPLDDVRHNLDRAAELYAWANASPADLARNDVARARVHLLQGEESSARALADDVARRTDPEMPIVAAEAWLVLGQAAMATGDRIGALAAYRRAVELMTGIGADRTAGQLWFELADLLEQTGAVEESRDAYRSAAAAAGLRAPSRRAVRVEQS